VTPPSSVLDPVVTPPSTVLEPVVTPPSSVLDPVVTPPAIVLDPVVTPLAVVLVPIVAPQVIVLEPVVTPHASGAGTLVAPQVIVLEPVVTPQASAVPPAATRPVASGVWRTGLGAVGSAQAVSARTATIASRAWRGRRAGTTTSWVMGTAISDQSKVRPRGTARQAPFGSRTCGNGRAAPACSSSPG